MLDTKWNIPLLTSKEFAFLEESNQIEGEEGVDRDHVIAFMKIKKYLYNYKWKILDKEVICKIHSYLMRHKLRKCIGEYREVPVWISGSGKRFVEPAHIELKMDEWFKDFNKMEKSPWQLHKEYENIHPFIDGNGRTGRLFWALDLLRRDKDVYPILDDFCDRWHVADGFDGKKKRINRLDSFNECRHRYYKALDDDSTGFPTRRFTDDE